MPNETDGSTPPSPDTNPAPDADVKMTNAVNAAVTAHLKRFAEKQLPAIFEAQFKSFADTMAKAAPPPKSEDEGEQKKPAKKEASPETIALQTELADLKAKLAKEAEARSAAEKKARDDRAKNELRSALQPAVKPEFLEILSDNLFHLKQVVDFEEDGTPVFKSKRTDPYGIEEEIRLPLKQGVEQFLKSADAKPFLPSSGGAAATPVRRAQSGLAQQGAAPIDTSKMSEKDRIAAATEMAKRLEAATQR